MYTGEDLFQMRAKYTKGNSYMYARFDYDDRVYIPAVVDRLAEAYKKYAEFYGLSQDTMYIQEIDFSSTNSIDNHPKCPSIFCIMYNISINRIYLIIDHVYVGLPFLSHCGAILCFGHEPKVSDEPQNTWFQSLCVARLLISNICSFNYKPAIPVSSDMVEFSYKYSIEQLRTSAILKGAHLNDKKTGVTHGINNKTLIIHQILSDLSARTSKTYLRAYLVHPFNYTKEMRNNVGIQYIDFYKTGKWRTTLSKLHCQLKSREYQVAATNILMKHRSNLCEMARHSIDVAITMGHYTSKNNERDRLRSARVTFDTTPEYPIYVFSLTMDNKVHVSGRGCFDRGARCPPP